MIIRTLGYYQPFCSLMLPPHYKDETRWVRKGKKPPFPIGSYVFYSTKKPCTNLQLFEWCGPEIMLSITNELKNEDTQGLNGYVIGGGDLAEVSPMTKEDEAKGFVKFIGERTVKDKKGNDVVQVQWLLRFENVTRITPEIFTQGKQGVGILKS